MNSIKRIGMTAIALALAVPVAFAAEVPQRPVEIVAGASPGGGYDMVARLIQRTLMNEKLINVPVTVTNQPGGGGAVGWSYINRVPGDMHYLSMVATAFLSNELLGVSPLKVEDFTPIANLVNEDLCFAVNPKGKIKSVDDLLQALKTDPASLRFGFSTGIGNQNHVALAFLATELGVDVKKIRTAVYGGAAEAVAALLGGNIDFSISGAATYAGYHKSGELKCVAMASANRLGGDLADVPTWKELGVNLVYSPSRGVIAPGGLSAEQIAFWEDTLRKMSETEAWKKAAADNYWVVEFKGHKDTFAAMKEERTRLDAAYVNLAIKK
jgi:putative tricarboxylic transport membrane protein